MLSIYTDKFINSYYRLKKNSQLSQEEFENINKNIYLDNFFYKPEKILLTNSLTFFQNYKNTYKILLNRDGNVKLIIDNNFTIVFFHGTNHSCLKYNYTY